MKLHLKLRRDASTADRTVVEDVARKNGASGLRPLFPSVADSALRSMYTVEVSAAKADRLCDQLKKIPSVEFVEREVERTLKSR
jgi:hypothetical protein